MTGYSPRADIPVRVGAFAADATGSCAIAVEPISLGAVVAIGLVGGILVRY